MEVFVARQPIFTTKKKIFGYELLFRSGLENSFPDIDGDIATSKYFNRRIPIDTIKDAIAYIGGEELRKFIKVAVMSDLGAKKPNELIRISIIRARMCERCVKIFKTKFSGDELFTLGLFSLMDALLDCKMEDILGHIALSDKMKIALLGNDKKFNRILDIIIGFERGDWENSIFKAMSGSALETKLPNLYFDSVKMADAFY